MIKKPIQIKGIVNEEFTSESQWVYWFFLIEGVAAAYTVNDRCDVVLSGMVELACLSIHDAGRPAVVGSAVALPQGADDILKAELISHLVENVNVSCQLQLAGGNICVAWLESKNLLSILFVANANVYICLLYTSRCV